MGSPSHLLGIACALASAMIWGSGDFSGGLAARRNHQFHVLAISSLSGMAMLFIFALIWHEGWPSPRGTLLAMLAGVFGAMGLASLYHGLAIGSAAVVAPTAAVIGAALPVGYGFFTEGLPETSKLLGLLLALVGIWLVSQSSAAAQSAGRRGFWLGCLAGVGFGMFFILIALVEHGVVFTPLILERVVAFGIALLLIRFNRLPAVNWKASPVALLAGVLDAGGNVFFLLARQYTRMDIAAVLSSLYPAMTILLAGLILKERASRRQAVGAVVCLAASVLIAI